MDRNRACRVKGGERNFPFVSSSGETKIETETIAILSAKFMRSDCKDHRESRLLASCGTGPSAVVWEVVGCISLSPVVCKFLCIGCVASPVEYLGCERVVECLTVSYHRVRIRAMIVRCACKFGSVACRLVTVHPLAVNKTRCI